MCTLGEFRPNLSHGIILLAKQFEAIGAIERARDVLEEAIENNLSKYEGHSLYLEVAVRMAVLYNSEGKNGNEGDIFLVECVNYMCNNIFLLTSETRYKFCLELAEKIEKFGQYSQTRSFQELIEDACSYAEEFCKKGSGLDRAKRHIYFTVLNCLGLLPPQNVLRTFPEDNQIKYQQNRWLFINGYALHRHEFTDWKFYLHFAL